MRTKVGAAATLLILLALLFVTYTIGKQHFTDSLSRLLTLAFVPLFVLLTVGAILLGRHRTVRIGYLAGFFSLLLLFNLLSTSLLPVNDLHKFSESAPSEEEVYQMYVVDERGERLRFDRRIVPTVSPPTAWPAVLLTDCSPRERVQVGRYLLSRARTYRTSITDGGPPLDDWVDFPRHHLDYRWTERALRSYGQFTGLVVDKVTIRFETDSYDVADRNRSTVFGVTLPDDYSPSRLSALPRCS